MSNFKKLNRKQKKILKYIKEKIIYTNIKYFRFLQMKYYAF